MKLYFRNVIRETEVVDATQHDINGRTYYKFTPRDGKPRLVYSENPCIEPFMIDRVNTEVI